MTANVIASLKLGLTPERLDELRAQGIEVEEHVDLTDLRLPEPAYGEVVVGTLTESEAALFRTLFTASSSLEDRLREAIGNTISQVGHAVRTSDRSKPLAEVFGSRLGELSLTDEQRREIARLQQMNTYLHAMLHFSLGERLGMHEFRLGVRSKHRVVQIGMRL